MVIFEDSPRIGLENGDGGFGHVKVCGVGRVCRNQGWF
jgi:hypothetical protein